MPAEPRVVKHFDPALPPDSSVPCRLYGFATAEDEARMFMHLSKPRLPLTTRDRRLLKRQLDKEEGR